MSETLRAVLFSLSLGGIWLGGYLTGRLVMRQQYERRVTALEQQRTSEQGAAT